MEIITIVTSPTTVKRLQVTYEDLGKMDWEQAKKACAELGSGWRLPTLDELKAMYKELHRKGKGNFRAGPYWSGTDHWMHAFVWYCDFGNGEVEVDANYYKNSVRAVRDLD